MRKILLHIFLLSYTVVLFKPVLPYVKDTIEHMFFYANHMATVHYENGQYHVHYDLAKDVKNEHSDKSSSTSKKGQESNDELVTLFNSNNYFSFLHYTNYPLCATPDIVASLHKINYPPPRNA